MANRDEGVSLDESGLVLNIAELTELRLDGRSFGPGADGVRLPHSDGWMHSGVAILRDGSVAVAHPQGRQLLVADESGNVRSIVQTPLTEMHALVPHPFGDEETLWIADNGHRFEKHGDGYLGVDGPGRVVRMDLAGEIVQELVQPYSPASGVSWQPTAICVDADRGRIWVADGYGADLVHVFGDDGGHLHTIDGTETGTAFSCPHGLARRFNDVYVADRTNRRLVVYSATDYTLQRVVGQGRLDSPSAMAVVGEDMVVTELFGGVAVFHADKYRGHYGRGLRSPDEDAWPNRRTSTGAISRPDLGAAFNSPHGIVSDGQRIILTEWLIGGRVAQLLPLS